MITLTHVLLALGGMTALIGITGAIWSVLDTRRHLAATATSDGSTRGADDPPDGSSSVAQTTMAGREPLVFRTRGAFGVSTPEAMMRSGPRVVVYTATPPFADAIEVLTNAIEINPSNFDLLRNMGLACGGTGEYERSVEFFDRALALNPENAPTYRDRGMAYAAMDQFENALADLHHAISLTPEDGGAYHDRGLTKIRLGEIDAAIEDLDQAIMLNPDDHQPYVDRAHAWARKGDLESAFADFNRATAIFPSISYFNLIDAESWASQRSGVSSLDETRGGQGPLGQDVDFIRLASGMQPEFERMSKVKLREAIASKLDR